MRWCFFAKLTRTLLVLVSLAGLCLANEPDEETWRDALDPAAALWRRIEAGTAVLDNATEQSFLRGLLRELDIPVESQVLVFSKTSLQKDEIEPSKPRAIYFNEDCYVGWVQGGEIEVAAAEPGGELQYYLIHRGTEEKPRPVLTGSNQCLSCHVGGNLQIQSVHTRSSGYPIGNADRFVTTYESPLSERWGGWYVTGRHGQERHMGNAITERLGAGVHLDRESGANADTLEKWFPLNPYLTTTSDIVALMVLEHQYVMHNTLNEANKSVQRMLRRMENGDAVGKEHGDKVLQKQAGEIVEKLLYMGEYELQGEGVTGSPDFQKAFTRNKLTAPDGSSLKDFQLKTHLFQHRCSYMIYSASFRGLPEPLRLAVYQRLRDVLSESSDAEEYAYIPTEEKRRTQEILEHTLPEMKGMPVQTAP